MRLTTKYFFVGMAIVALLALIFFSASFLINSASNQINTFYVSKVDGVPNFSNPGGEAFWTSVPTITVPLIPSSNYAPSGATQTVSVQIAWTTATARPELLVKMKFSNYGTGPSYSSPTPVFVNDTAYPSGDVMQAYQNSSCTSQFSSCFGNLYPQDIGTLPLAIGPSYIYPEQSTVLLGISPGANTDAWYAVSYKPKMVMGTPGALDTGSGGQAEFWTWSSNPTDNSSRDAGYPGIAYPNGSALSTASFGLPAYASYAMDGYANASGYYQLGGMPSSSEFLYLNDPSVETNNLSSITSVSNLWNPFEVQAKGVYDSGSNSWTVEYVRNLTTTSQFGENNYQVQYNSSNPDNYYIAFEINQGQASETYLIYYGSVSFWWRLNFQGTPGYVNYSNQYGSILQGNSFSLASSVLLVLYVVLSALYRRLQDWQHLPRFSLPHIFNGSKLLFLHQK
jgi:hypothetical protein